jgi:hypothetical protein
MTIGPADQVVEWYVLHQRHVLETDRISLQGWDWCSGPS